MAQVNIITASYNAGKYILRAIESILVQSFTDWELIVIDDGSTDNTKEIISQYLADSRIRYIYQFNQGQAAARNKAFSVSNGKYIAILDADDIWEPNKLEKQLTMFGKNKDLGLVYTGVQNIDAINKNLPTKKTTDITNNPLKYQILSNRITFSSFMLKRECVDNFIHHERYPITGDQYLSLSIILNGWKVGFVPDKLVKYRIHSAGMTRSVDEIENRFNEKISLIKEISVESRRRGISQKVIKKALALVYLARAVEYIKSGDKKYKLKIRESIIRSYNLSKDINVLAKNFKWYIKSLI